MIVRIMGEGQVKLDDSHFAELNTLDDELLSEMETGDEDGFRRTLTALLSAVRT
ncbi:MAG: PspA-associated protein PspAA, partial [Streptomyces sp.]